MSTVFSWATFHAFWRVMYYRRPLYGRPLTGERDMDVRGMGGILMETSSIQEDAFSQSNFP
jgi:hypothetical protein